jgi:nicotinamide-nucleotide amidase
MNCEIINVGTELILGQNLNTNSRDISVLLAASGIDCYYHTSVGDNLERIVNAIETAFKRSDAVIITGGLGSTDDDLTREAVARATGKRLIGDTGLEAWIKERLRQFEPGATEKAMRQAQIPEGSIIIKPTLGTAAGFITRTDGGHYVAATPGVPAEMMRMLESDILPVLAPGNTPGSFAIVSRVLKVYGLREVETERMIQDIIDGQTNPTVAPLIGKGAVTLRISAKANTRDEAESLIAGMDEQIRERLGAHIFAIDSEEMEDVVGDLLKNRGLTIACGESITGGMCASRLINTAGSSAYVRGGIVAYDNDIKISALGVSPQTLLNHGAVSPATAEEMAVGVRKALGADIGLSTTGIAGPDGVTKDKPVGLVHFALSTADALIHDKKTFHGNRNDIRFKASQHALNMVRVFLSGGEGRETA